MMAIMAENKKQGAKKIRLSPTIYGPSELIDDAILSISTVYSYIFGGLS